VTRRPEPLLLMIIAVAATAVAFGSTLAPPYPRPPVSPTADAALVLSGDVDYRRIARAADLYRTGAVSLILVTGTGIGGDSAEELKAVAVRLGVPPDAVRLEAVSTTTRENLVQVAPMIRSAGWKRVSLVTNGSHMGRASLAARRALPEVEWILVPVPDPGPSSRIVKVRLQEWAKLAWYAVRGWI
jgi:uncharacterized SAM-binding protein YcdF (DUF218 family)